MKNIALVMGGYSGEYEISIMSGNQVYSMLDHEKYDVRKIVINRERWVWMEDDQIMGDVDKNDFSIMDHGRKILFDLAFIIIHGNPGENGVLQGYFDMLGIRYTTCDFYTSALTFNKGFCNAVVRNYGIVNVANSRIVYGNRGINVEKLLAKVKLPLFVKPASGGSSVATTKVKRKEDLEPAIREALKHDSQVMVEEFISGREFDCGVMNYKGKKFVFPITEIIPTGGHEFFDYEAKYQGFSNEVTPAEVDESIKDEIQMVSSKLYDLLNCKGVVRFDFIYDTERKMLYFLEVNTIPGQSAESIVPKQARAMGISTQQLYEMIIESSL